MAEMKFKREWFFGGEKKDTEMEDWVSAYVREDGLRIEVKYAFGNNHDRWYEVGGRWFSTLKAAKAYCL